jgi:branched-chain amino acid transport system permease protein
MIANILLYGSVNGVILMLSALGFSLVFGLSGIANLAHGGLYILAGYLAWMLLNYLNMPFLLSIAGSIIIVSICGAALYRLVILPIRGITFSEIIATYAALVAILEFFRWMGFTTYEYALPNFIDGSVDIAGATLDYQRLFIVAIGFFLLVFLWVFTHHTKYGLALRAIAQEEYTALSVGIDSDWAATISMALGGALAAVAAITILPLGLIHVNLGYNVLLIALAVTVLGGMESIAGLVVASFLLGYAQVFVSFYLGTHWVEVVYLLTIIVILAIKPSGLFGKFQELEERV